MQATFLIRTLLVSAAVTGLALPLACRNRAGGSTALAAAGDVRTSELKGKGGEVIRLQYTQFNDQDTPHIRLESATFATPRAFIFHGSPVTAYLIFSSTDDSAVQSLVSASCRVEGQRSICEATQPQALFEVDSASEGFPARGINMTVVFDGMPVVDSFDGKPFFVWKG
jgi:hypothetical protein